MTSPSPAIVAFIWHVERRALERGLVLDQLAELVLNHHDRRWRNAGRADWIISASGITVYDWPDGDDSTTAIVISAWRE